MQVKEEPESKQKAVSRRKIIQKVHRKVQRENRQLAKDFKWVEKEPRSALGSFMSNNAAEECDFDMANHITMGQNRKLKRKMKKLQKKMPTNEEGVFREMQKYKQTLYRGHEKKIFNPVNELQKRRDRRMKKMELNAKRRKAEVTQKKLEQFE